MELDLSFEPVVCRRVLALCGGHRLCRGTTSGKGRADAYRNACWNSTDNGTVCELLPCQTPGHRVFVKTRKRRHACECGLPPKRRWRHHFHAIRHCVHRPNKGHRSEPHSSHKSSRFGCYVDGGTTSRRRPTRGFSQPHGPSRKASRNWAAGRWYGSHCSNCSRPVRNALAT